MKSLSTKVSEDTPSILATEITLAQIKTDLDEIAIDTDNLDVALSTLATEATLGDVKTDLDSLVAKDYATETTLGSVLSAVDDIEPKLDTLIAKDYATETTLVGLKSDFEGVDFSTETTLATRLSESDFDTKIALVATEATLGDIKSDLDTISGHVDVDLSTVATEATLSDIKTAQTDGSQETKIVDASNNAVTSSDAGGGIRALDVNVASGITLEVNLDNADDDVLVYGWDGSTNQKIKTDVDGNLQVDVLSTSLDGVDFATETTLLAILAKIDVTVTGEVPTGAINGMNDFYTTFFSYKPGSTRLYLNGIRQQEGLGFDYVENVAHTIVTFAIPPLGGDTILVDYIKA